MRHWSRGTPRAWALAVVVVATVGPGCLGGPQRRSNAELEAERQAEETMRKAFLAEFDVAMAAKDYEKAAAAFTPERHAKLHRYTFAWGGNQDKLWSAIQHAAEQAEQRGALATSLVLCRLMEKMQLSESLRRSVDSALAEYKRKLDAQLTRWNQQLEPAQADEQAGRTATAAMRYAALTSAPSKALLAQAQATVCDLVAKAALPYRTSVHLAAGKGDAALLQRILAAAAAAHHGSAVVLTPQAAEADLTITVSLPPEKVEQTSRVETRSGRYVSGQKAQPNPQVQSLQEDNERFEKEARWHEGKVASIRCTGSGKCSTESHRNSARSFRQKLADAQKKLRSEPATKMGPVYSDLSYDVKIQRTRLVQPVAYAVTLRDGQKEARGDEVDRFAESVDQPAVPQLGLAAKPAVVVKLEQLRSELHDNLVKSSGHVVYANLERRNAGIVAKVKAASGAEKAEVICTYLAVNPMATADSIAFANTELSTLVKVQGGGTALAAAAQRCAAGGQKAQRTAPASP